MAGRRRPSSPDKIQRQWKLRRSAKKLKLISCGWETSCIGQEGEIVPTALWCDLDPLEWLLRKWEGNLHMQTATWLVSRESTSAAGPGTKRLLVDNDGE